MVDVFAFAGLWDRWTDPRGEVVESCTILTTTPNALLADIHDRMPAILRPDDYDLWLNPTAQNTESALRLPRRTRADASVSGEHSGQPGPE